MVLFSSAATKHSIPPARSIITPPFTLATWGRPMHIPCTMLLMSRMGANECPGELALLTATPVQCPASTASTLCSPHPRPRLPPRDWRRPGIGVPGRPSSVSGDDGEIIAGRCLIYTDSRPQQKLLQDQPHHPPLLVSGLLSLRDFFGLFLVPRCVGRSPPLAPPVFHAHPSICRAPACAAHGATGDDQGLDHLLRRVPHLGHFNQLLRPKTNVSTWTSLVPQGS